VDLEWPLLKSALRTRMLVSAVFGREDRVSMTVECSREGEGAWRLRRHWMMLDRTLERSRALSSREVPSSGVSERR
jgi:hypothetical protein